MKFRNQKRKQPKINLVSTGALLATAFAFGARAQQAVTPANNLSEWQKPVWLTDLSLGVKESYDDNVLLVSGDGLPTQSSWVTTISPKIGFNFAPLFGKQNTLQALTFTYAPDINLYHETPEYNYTAHKFGDTIKGQAGNFSYLLDNAFLDVDGSHQAPIYALSQGVGGNQFDQFRNNFAHAVARERLAQLQDRANVQLRYDWDHFFIRPNASLLDYDLMTDWHNTGAAPWEGYQNYVSRYDVNGGVDFGYKFSPRLAAVLGYRYGSQYQQQFPASITSDNHYSSSDYNRLLLGLEGQPWSWLNVKFLAGPDFRDYNSMAPIGDKDPIMYYGEGVFTATLSPSQSLTFNYKQWQWVSSTGKVPEFDSSYVLGYHWSATKQLGVDLGGKVMEADYRSGDDYSGATQPSRRNDMEYELSAGLTYAFTPHLSGNLAYTYDLGDSALDGLPANLAPGYRDFEHQVVSVGMVFKF